MTEITLDSAAFDKLLADLEPKPCPHCEGLERANWCRPGTGCWGTGSVPGVAVIPLEHRAEFLTIREADQPAGEGDKVSVVVPSNPPRTYEVRRGSIPSPRRSVVVSVIGWVDGQLTVEKL